MGKRETFYPLGHCPYGRELGLVQAKAGMLELYLGLPPLLSRGALGGT